MPASNKTYPYTTFLQEYLLREDTFPLSLPLELERLFDTIHLINVERANEDMPPLRCTEILDFSHLGSPATLHKRLKILTATKFLQYQSNVDARNKPIILGPIGEKRLEWLSKAIKNAARIKK